MIDAVLERRYVGALMLDASAADRAGVSLDDVTDPQARHVLECVFSLRDQGVDVNPDTLDLELGRKGYDRDRQLNVMAWARGLDDIAAVAARLRELSEAREIHAVAGDVARIAKSTGDPAKARERLRDLLDLGRRQGPADRVLNFRQVCVKTAEVLATPVNERGMRLGWPSIDAVYQLAPGQLMVLGAQTNVGKTSAIATWALHLAESGNPAAVISCEDGADDFGAKWIGELCRVNPERLWRGQYGDGAKQLEASIIEAAKRGIPLYFSEVASRSLDEVLADMAHAKHAHGVKVVMVDYLQAIQLPPGSRDMRTGTDQNLAALISQAGRLGVALVLACQLSRPGKDKPYREPNKHDLKESGTIENRAQCIVMMWRDESGDVKAKIDKAKRTSFTTTPFGLTRHPATGKLWERADEEPSPYSQEEVDRSWGY